MRTVVSLHDLVKSKEDALKKTEKKATVLEMDESDDDMFFYYDYPV